MHSNWYADYSIFNVIFINCIGIIEWFGFKLSFNMDVWRHSKLEIQTVCNKHQKLWIKIDVSLKHKQCSYNYVVWIYLSECIFKALPSENIKIHSKPPLKVGGFQISANGCDKTWAYASTMRSKEFSITRRNSPEIHEAVMWYARRTNSLLL